MKPVRNYPKVAKRHRFQPGDLGILPRPLRKSGPGETLPWRSSLKIAFLRTAFPIAARAAHRECFATSFFLPMKPPPGKSSAKFLKRLPRPDEQTMFRRRVYTDPCAGTSMALTAAFRSFPQ